MRHVAALVAATLLGMYALAISAMAAEPPARPQGPPGPPRVDFIRELGLTGEKAKQVEAILQNEREQHRAAHERARAELAKVLTADEMARFEALQPRPRGPMGPPPERR